jgi:hypothetical protein
LQFAIWQQLKKVSALSTGATFVTGAEFINVFFPAQEGECPRTGNILEIECAADLSNLAGRLKRDNYLHLEAAILCASDPFP